MDKHDHKDGFIPKYLLEKLAEKGNEAAKQTLITTEKIEQKTAEIKKKTGLNSNRSRLQQDDPSAIFTTAKRLNNSKKS
jgi:hypothetical protein